MEIAADTQPEYEKHNENDSRSGLSSVGGSHRVVLVLILILILE